jgi:opacity protein-like surface antigen
MKKSKHTKVIILTIITIAISLTFTSCNKDKAAEDTSTTQAVSTDTSTSAVVSSTEKTESEKPAMETTAETMTEKPEAPVAMQSNKLDIESLGFELKDNLLYYRGTLLSANKIINYSIEKDNAKFNNADSSSIYIDSEGNVTGKFPVGLQIDATKNLETIMISYDGTSFILPSITNFTSDGEWYNLVIDKNMSIRFNDTTIEAHIDDVTIGLESDGFTTMFNDIVITESAIDTYEIHLPMITINYADGAMMQHKIGGETTYTLPNGVMIEESSTKTKITQNNETKTIEGKLTSISMDETTGNIVLASDNDSYTIMETPAAEMHSEDTMVAEAPVEETSAAVTEDAAAVDSEMTEVEQGSEDSQTTIADAAVEQTEVSVADHSLAQTTEDFADLSLFEPKELNPYHIGLLGNYTMLNGKLNSVSDFAYFGARLDMVIEREVSDNTTIGFELGFGADRFDGNFFKELIPMFTISYDLNFMDSEKFTPYLMAGVGSLIPISEDGETPYFRAKAGLGIKYDINDSWMIKAGVNYAFNYHTDNIVHAVEVPVGLIYKFN